MPDDIISKVNQALQKIKDGREADRKQSEQSNKALVQGVSKEIVAGLTPILERFVKASEVNAQRIESALSGVSLPAPQVNIPDVRVPDIRVPAPIVNYTPPAINIPDVVMPDEMNVKGFVSLMGVDLQNPLPVQLRTPDGTPMNLFENLTQIVSGGGGFRHVLVDNLDEVSVTVSGGTDSSVSLVNADGTYYDSDNPLPVTIGSTVTQPVSQVSGAIWSVNVAGADASVGAAIIDSSGVQYSTSNPLPVTLATALDRTIDSIATFPVSSANYSVYVTGSNGSVSATIIDSSGVGYSGSNPVPVNLVSQSLASSASAIVDSTGVQYSGSNPFPVTASLSGSLTSAVVTGPVVSDATDDNSAPVQVGGIARQANPTAVAAGDAVKATYDDLGRAVGRPVQVRDLIGTAYASVTNITETTLISGASGVFNDLISVVGANQSDAAVTLDFRASTGGTVCFTLELPASGTAGISWQVPYPAPATASSWTFQNAASDDSGTAVDVTATYSKEV